MIARAKLAAMCMMVTVRLSSLFVDLPNPNFVAVEDPDMVYKYSGRVHWLVYPAAYVVSEVVRATEVLGWKDKARLAIDDGIEHLRLQENPKDLGISSCYVGETTAMTLIVPLPHR